MDDPLATISPRRRAINRVVVGAVDGTLDWLARRWLLLWNGALALLIGGAFAGPALEAAGQEALADRVYALYQTFCHQLPYRSSYVFGHKVCLCDRCVALYAGLLLGGLIYTRLRGRLRSISLFTFALFAVPMALDGFTQLFGWRESDLTLRLVTGLVFGLGAAWLAYPLFDQGARTTAAQLIVTRPPLAPLASED